MFNQYDCFILSKSVPNEHIVSAGTKGVILEVWGGNPCAYEVEFVGENGQNLGKNVTFTLTEDYMIAVPETTAVLSLPSLPVSVSQHNSW